MTSDQYQHTGVMTDDDVAEVTDRFQRFYGVDRAAAELAVAHSQRFRLVSTRYPHMVALAYDRDVAAAAVDTDDQVAAKVAEWERAQGVEPRDWHAIGADERDEERNR
jgi:hypothetical protein